MIGAYLESSNSTTIVNSASGYPTDTAASGAGAAYVYTKSGSTVTAKAFLKPAVVQASDQFGYSVAISGDTIAVGANQESSSSPTGVSSGSVGGANTSANHSGAVYIFKYDGTNWSQQAYIKSPTPTANDLFGASVALYNNTLVIGVPGESSSVGGVYVYTRSGTTWTQVAHLTPANSSGAQAFGNAVAIYDTKLVVGSYNEASSSATQNTASPTTNTAMSNAGAAYVYEYSASTWTMTAFLKAANVASGSYFGASVAISSDKIVVGATSESSNQTTITNGSGASSNTAAVGAGAAYVYTLSSGTWSETAYLKPSNNVANNGFGNAVAISGYKIVVGASQEGSNQSTVTNGTGASSDTSTGSAGAAYVFNLGEGNWHQEAYLKPPNPFGGGNFGYNVAISGNYIVSGSVGDSSNQTTIDNSGSASSDTSNLNAGAAYLFYSP